MRYGNVLSGANVPQTEPLNSQQIENKAGGFVYEADCWQQLERFLIMGSLEPNYYFGQRELTTMNVDKLRECLMKDGVRFVQTLTQISTSGRAIKNDPAIFALAYAIKNGDDNARKEAYAVLSHVCRIGTHLFSLAEELSQMEKGWGGGFKRAVQRWYQTKNEKGTLEYEIVKYKQRAGWSHKDLLRLSHAKLPNVGAAAYATGKKIEDPSVFLLATEALKSDIPLSAKAHLIKVNRLPREVIPTELLNERTIWEALLENMPLTAMIRNLGKMSSLGLFGIGENIVKVTGALSNPEVVRRARVHPLTLAIAMAQYRQGKGLKGSLSWIVCDSIVHALSNAIHLSMDYVEPLNDNILVVIDSSGSMTSTGSELECGLGLHETAVIMATAWVSKEPMCDVIAVDTQFRGSIAIKGRRMDDIVRDCEKRGGGTDMTAWISWAIQNNKKYGLVVIFTDIETWAGRQHPEIAIKEYRKICPNIKVVNCAMTSSNSKLSNNDPMVMEAVGFDASLPKIIDAFYRLGKPWEPGAMEDTEE